MGKFFYTPRVLPSQGGTQGGLLVGAVPRYAVPLDCTSIHNLTVDSPIKYLLLCLFNHSEFFHYNNPKLLLQLKRLTEKDTDTTDFSLSLDGQCH